MFEYKFIMANLRVVVYSFTQLQIQTSLAYKYKSPLSDAHRNRDFHLPAPSIVAPSSISIKISDLCMGLRDTLDTS